MNCMDYLKTEKFPLFWCPGCGNGVVLGAIARAFAELDLTRENTVVVTGIGCWGKAASPCSRASRHVETRAKNHCPLLRRTLQRQISQQASCPLHCFEPGHFRTAVQH